MKFAHCLVMAAMCGTLCSAASADNQPTSAATVIGYDPNPAQVIRVRHLLTGREIPQANARPRGTVTGYDNLSSPNSSAMLNVAYVNPGSYNGSNPSTTASIFGLGNGPAGSSLRAPTNAAAPNPTDIVWNDYTGDPTIWPNGAGMNANGVEFDIVTVRVNQSGLDRIDSINILFFSADGATFIDGFGVDVATPIAFAAYQRVNIDLTGANPAIQIPQDGLVMVDYIPVEGMTEIIGVGLAFAGGDLANAIFPTPESLVTVGTSNANDWAFADHVTGDAEHPMGPDPMFDMTEGLSYLDLLNTGQLTDWQFTATNPTRTFSHDFPILIMVTAGTPGEGACVVTKFNECFQTSQANCEIIGGTFLGGGSTCGGGAGACCVNAVCQAVAFEAVCTVLAGTYQGEGSGCGPDSCTGPACPCNFNADGFLNSQDFFDFIACFFAPPGSCAAADYNADTFINSQDFFDFLGCFFAPPPGCP
jgi:hypothetical protein